MIVASTPDMFCIVRKPSISWPRPVPRLGDCTISSAAISERQENAQPCFRPAR